MSLFHLHLIRARVRHYGPCEANEFERSGVRLTLMRRARAAKWARSIRRAIRDEYALHGMSAKALRLVHTLYTRVLGYHLRRSSFARYY